MYRPNLTLTTNIAGAIVLSAFTMGLKYIFDKALQVDSRFLLSTLCVATCAFLFARAGGYTAAICNLIGQSIYFYYRTHGYFKPNPPNPAIDGLIVLMTFAITSMIIIHMINRAMQAHLVSLAAIKSMNAERAISIELRHALEGAVDAVAEPLFIFNPVHNDVGEVVDFKIRYTNSSEPFQLPGSSNLTAKEIIGKDITQVSPQIVETGLLGKLLEVYATGKAVETDYTIKTDEGIRVYEIAAKRVGVTLVAQWRKHMKVAIPAA